MPAMPSPAGPDRATPCPAVPCHACHALVPDHDFVFSRPMFEAVLDYKKIDAREETLLSKFIKASDQKQLERVQKVLGDAHLESERFGPVNYLEMKLFEGSLPELRAPLTKLASAKAEVFLTYDPETKFYAIAHSMIPTTSCAARVHYVTGSLDKLIPDRNLKDATTAVTLCNGEVEPKEAQ